MSQDNIIIKRLSVKEYLAENDLSRLWSVYNFLSERIVQTESYTTTLNDMAKALKLSRRTVFTHLDKLKELHLIYKISHGQNGTEIVLLSNSATKVAKPSTTTTYKKKLHDSIKDEIKPANSATAKEVSDNDLDVNSATDFPNDSNMSLKTPILDNTYIESNTYIDTIPKIGIKPIGPSELENNVSNNLAPSLPTTAEAVALSKLNFPLKVVATNISAIWYWIIKRYELHGLDFLVVKDSFAKMAMKFAKTIPKYVGKDFVEMQKYIDWYLSSKDKFISDQTQYGFEYMVSVPCINRYKGDTNKKQQTMVSTHEERAKLRGKWHK